MADAKYVERRDAIRSQLAAQGNRCPACHKMISAAYSEPTKVKGAYKLPEIGEAYDEPLLCSRCWEKQGGTA